LEYQFEQGIRTVGKTPGISTKLIQRGSHTRQIRLRRDDSRRAVI